jgi:hypothetical protein
MIRNCGANLSSSRGAAADPSSAPLLMKQDDLACVPLCPLPEYEADVLRLTGQGTLETALEFAINTAGTFQTPLGTAWRRTKREYHWTLNRHVIYY